MPEYQQDMMKRCQRESTTLTVVDAIERKAKTETR